MTSDRPDSHPAVIAKLGEIAELRRKTDLAEAELRGMRAVLSGHSPSPTYKTARVVQIGAGVPPAFEPKAGGYRGGRQPGAISQLWRSILSDLYWYSDKEARGANFTIETLTFAADARGIRVRPAEAQARMKSYEDHQYVMPVLGGYRVTENAAQKFGFDKNPLNETAPSTEAKGA